MEWQPVGTITTTRDYAFTPVVTSTLFKLKHTSAIATKSDLKIVIRQAFEDDDQLALFDYKLINCKAEQDILLFSLPKGLPGRKLAIKRVDNLSDSWSIEIESLNFVEQGVDVPITLSDLLELQQQINSLTDAIALKALDIDLDNHTANTNNPHSVTAQQVGADPVGSAIASVATHESTTNHPIATTSDRGMMAAADKSKLDGIAPGATANENNAFLLNRNNHKGTQPVSTVEGLQAAFDSFVNLTTSQIISGVKSFNNLVYLAQQLIVNTYITANNYYFGNTPLSVEILRTVTTTNNFCTDIGYFDLSDGGVSFRLNLVISDTYFSLAKTYIVVTSFASDTGWLKLIPLKESVHDFYNNCEIDIRIHLTKTYLRIRRTGGDGYNGTAIIRLEFTGYSGTYFEETFNTTVDNNVTGTY